MELQGDTIVHWPKGIQKRGITSDVLTSQIDWMAPLATLLGYNQTDRPWVIEQSANHTLSVRTRRWKYIEPNDGPAMVSWRARCETGNNSIPQLYDMEKSKSETDNVATRYPEIVFGFEKLLREIRTGK